MNSVKSRWTRAAGVTVLTLAVGVAGLVAESRAAEAKAKKASTAAAASKIDPRATEIVQRMAARIVAADRLSLSGEIAWDVVQADGQTLEFGATRDVVLQRPDRLRVDIDLREGGQRRLLYDGKQIVLEDLAHNVYATDPHTGPVDDMARVRGEAPRHSGRALGVPLAGSSEAAQRTTSSPRATSANRRSPACAATTSRCATMSSACSCGSARAIRCRAGSRSRTSTKPAGRSSARASPRWDLSPKITDATFAFDPPKGAEKIAFAPRPNAATQGDSK